MSDAVDDAIRYAREVDDGTMPAGKYVRLAARRFLDDLAASEAGTSPWEFRADLAAKPIRFAELIRNVKGPLAGKRLVLGAWQRFIYCNLMGWVERGTTTRRFRSAVIYVPRGNGKTTMMAPLALYMTFVEGEGGAETYAAAVTREQARILFDSACHMVRNDAKLAAKFGLVVNAHTIIQPRTASKFVPLASDAKSLEGLSVHFAVLDEIASHHTSHVYDAIQTGTGKRKHPLMVCISTATGNNSGIGRQQWEYAVRVLSGDQHDDQFFAVLYAADDQDDPWDEGTWIKANPGWGVSVQPDATRAIFNSARNNPAREASAFTRCLNRWVGSDEQLFSMFAWRNCADPTLTLEAFRGKSCIIGLDLASKTDIAAVSLIFPEWRGTKRHYTVFVKSYLPEEALLDGRNSLYPGWAREGHLTLTEGNETDFAHIERDILAAKKMFRVSEVAFDPWQACYLTQRLAAEGMTLKDVPQTTANLSEPTKELAAAMLAGRVHHDGNPVLAWAMGNVVGQYDRNDNVFPAKPKDTKQKDDPAKATIIGLCRVLLDEGPKVSVYQREARGITFL